MYRKFAAVPSYEMKSKAQRFIIINGNQISPSHLLHKTFTCCARRAKKLLEFS